ncbi:MAG: deoxyribose-phosphate aldolase [Pseudobdellovibrionaceae bacterium]
MQLSRYIDHTLLKPETQLAQIEKLCSEAKNYNFFSVCVNSSYVSICAQLLKESTVKVCCVIGFPLGAMDTASKSFETETAIKNGAEEIDMVINIGALKDGRLDFVRDDIKAVVSAAQGKTVKVIIETSLLSYDEKVLACKACLETGAHFVKTSTGFAGGGATIEDVQLMKSIVKDAMQVKASGGIKNADQALAMIDAGATRLGTSSGVTIMLGGTTKGEY